MIAGVVAARDAIELPSGPGRALVGLGCLVAAVLILAYGWAVRQANDREGDPANQLEVQVVLSVIVAGALLIAAVVLVVQGLLALV